MKFRLLSALFLVVVLAVCYFLFGQDDQPQQQPQGQDTGLVLH